MPLHNHTVIPELLSIDSNLDNIHYFSLGFFSDKVDEHLHSDSQYTALFKVVPELPDMQQLSKLDYFHHTPDGVLFKRPGVVDLRCFFKTSSNYLVECYCEEPYYRLMKMGIEGILPPAKLFFQELLTQLLLQDILPLHCSGVQTDSENVLFMAGSNTGKSFSAFSIADRLDGRVLTEDIAFFDGERCFGVHGLSAYSEYVGFSQGMFGLLNLLPFISYYPEKKAFHNTYPSKFTKAMQPTSVCVMQRSDKTSIDTLTTNQAIQQMRALNNFEFHYKDHDLLMARSFFEGEDAATLLAKKEDRLFKNITEAATVYKVSAPNHETLLELITTEIL